MLEVRDQVVSYGAIQAVRGVSLTASPGAITAIVGANGAGKSSLPRAVSGLAPVRSGQILWDGIDITRVSPSRRAALRLAHAMEGRRIFRHLSIEENLQLAWQLGRRRNTSDAAGARVFATFPILRERRRVHAGLLSGGQQQMMIVSSAAICDPTYLLLDESSLGLAPIIVRDLRVLYSTLTRGRLAEQIAALALKVLAHGYVFREGRIVRDGPSRELADTDLVPALSSAYLYCNREDRVMSRFDSYAAKYSSIHMRRENGILEMRLHTDNGPLRWGLVPTPSPTWRMTATTAW